MLFTTINVIDYNYRSIVLQVVLDLSVTVPCHKFHWDWIYEILCTINVSNNVSICVIMYCSVYHCIQVCIRKCLSKC